MEEVEEEEQFLLQSKKRQQKLRGIIAVMGLPTTQKTRLACYIGEWAKCPVLCIQHFLDGYDKKAVVDAVEEAGDDRRRQLLVQCAFPRLLKVAKFHLSKKGNILGDYTVVIKSCLKSTFELDRLIELVTGTDTGSREKYPLLIIDCRFINEFRWKNHFESSKSDDARDVEDEVMRSWYRPASWNEMEDLIARDHDYQAKWDLHLQQLLLKASHHPPIVVRRLVVFPDNDDIVNAIKKSFGYDVCVSNNLADAIKYLLTTPHQKLFDTTFQNPYTVEYRDIRPYFVEKRLSAAESKGRREYLCPGGDCAFKYSEALILHHHDDDHDDDDDNLTYCGVCEGHVVSETPAYTCRKCTLTLHKSCAERVDFKALRVHFKYPWYYFRTTRLPEVDAACRSCVNAGKHFDADCGSCLFQTYLKYALLPTIINHDFHPHFLSLHLARDIYLCRACCHATTDFSYSCVRCASSYHIACAFLPLELLKHKHGGHEHVMKLMYSYHEDSMQQEEPYWCEVCYKDMDPEACYYLCQNCPCYLTHVNCSGGFQFLNYPKDVKLVQQLQPQLEDAFPQIFTAA